MKIITFIGLSTMLCISCYGQKNSKSWEHLNYTGDSMESHMLYIYLPEVKSTQYPAVIQIYGSARVDNNLKGTDFNTLSNALPDAGFAVVMPNHRSGGAIFPAQINDDKVKLI